VFTRVAVIIFGIAAGCALMISGLNGYREPKYQLWSFLVG